MSAFFVGNSFLEQHDIIFRVASISNMAQLPMIPGSMFQKGGSLHQLIEKHSKAISGMKEWALDRVVLQDHSLEALSTDGRIRSATAIQKFGGIAECTVLMATWARRADHSLYSKAGNPRSPEEMTNVVHAHYAEQAKSLNATVAPVGRVWLLAIKSGYDLHAKDGYHANETGAHLTALVLAHALGIPLPEDDPLAEIAATTPT